MATSTVAATPSVRRHGEPTNASTTAPGSATPRKVASVLGAWKTPADRFTASTPT